MKNNIITSSRKRTPWDDKENLEPLESFIVDVYHKQYDFKHPKLIETCEADLLNRYSICCCKHCGSANFKKFGKTKNGINRYYCNDCKKTFTITTNTIFENHKIAITEWIEFILELVSYGSFSSIARNNRNSTNTTLFWTHKLYLLLDQYSERIALKDVVFLDETFYSVKTKDIQVKENGKKPRGLSKNKYCIGIACDKKSTYAKIEGFGKTSIKRTRETFINHIQSNSKIVHDKEKSHKILIDELNLESKEYDSNELKKLKDKDNPLEPVNRKCYHLKRFLNAHSGFDRSDLQNLIYLFLFINNPPYDKLEKVKFLLNLALDTRVVLKFREKR